MRIDAHHLTTTRAPARPQDPDHLLAHAFDDRDLEVTRRQPDGTWKFLVDVPGGVDGATDLPSIPLLPDHSS